jgi:hypothetical protein
VRLAKFDMCQFNLRSPGSDLRMKKRTHVMTNSIRVFEILNGKTYDDSHPHQRIEGSENGLKRSVAAQVYTEEFCEAVCNAILNR